MILFYLICVWLICGAISMGITFAFFQKHWPSIRKDQFYIDQRVALMDLAWGPIALIANLFSKKHGWLWPYSKKARLEAGIND